MWTHMFDTHQCTGFGRQCLKAQIIIEGHRTCQHELSNTCLQTSAQPRHRQWLPTCYKGSCRFGQIQHTTSSITVRLNTIRVAILKLQQVSDAGENLCYLTIRYYLRRTLLWLHPWQHRLFGLLGLPRRSNVNSLSEL